MVNACCRCCRELMVCDLFFRVDGRFVCQIMDMISARKRPHTVIGVCLLELIRVRSIVLFLLVVLVIRFEPLGLCNNPIFK